MARVTEKQKNLFKEFCTDPSFNKVVESEFESLAGVQSEDDLRTVMIAFLVENEVDGVDNDSTEDLIDYCKAFVEEAPVVKQPIIKITPAPAATPGKKKVVVVEEEDEEDLLNQLADEVADDGSEIEEENGVRSTTVKAKTDAKSAAKTPKVTKVADKPKAQTVSTVGKKSPIAPSKGGEKFDARNNKQHKIDFIDGFACKHFPASDFRIDILKQGFTVRGSLTNAQPTLFNFDNLRIIDGKLTGDAYFNRFKSVEDLETAAPAEFLKDRVVGMFRGESHPSVKSVSQEDWIDLLFQKGVLKVALERAKSMDTKMGVNRIAMEEKLKQETVPVVPVVAPVKTAKKK